MPYDSASGAYIRRTTTILDETPDGDTVNTAVAVKLDTVGDDATADLNHHRVQGGHYPAPSVAAASRYLKQSPSGAVTWGEGVPIEQAAMKDLSNVPSGTTASINITGNAATATSATSATSASTAASCSGNAATASDMAVGHVLAGQKTAAAVRQAISAPSPDVGLACAVAFSSVTLQSIPSGARTVATESAAGNVLTAGESWHEAASADLSITVPSAGTYRIDASCVTNITASYVLMYVEVVRGGSVIEMASSQATRETTCSANTIAMLQAGDVVRVAVLSPGGATTITRNNQQRLAVQRVR